MLTPPSSTEKSTGEISLEPVRNTMTYAICPHRKLFCRSHPYDFLLYGHLSLDETRGRGGTQVPSMVGSSNVGVETALGETQMTSPNREISSSSIPDSLRLQFSGRLGSVRPCVCSQTRHLGSPRCTADLPGPCASSHGNPCRRFILQMRHLVLISTHFPFMVLCIGYSPDFQPLALSWFLRFQIVDLETSRTRLAGGDLDASCKLPMNLILTLSCSSPKRPWQPLHNL